ncbi:MAG: hypothetical protein EON58_02665 [Alphaproteobacteria bacterium]|nr:MAG: hypothetical protein EON58_02665 [Alphaproteobacteria bacterium]
MLYLMDRFRDVLEWWVSEIRSVRRAIQLFGRALPLKRSGWNNTAEALSPPRLTGGSKYAAIFRGRHLTLPHTHQLLPFSRCKEVSRTAASHVTPFDVNSVYILPTMEACGRLNSSILVKRNVLDAYLSEAACLNGKLDSLSIDDGSATVCVPTRALENLHPAYAHIRRRRNVSVVVLVVLCIISAGTYFHLVSRYSQASSDLDKLVASRRVEALKVRKLLDQREKIFDAIDAARKSKERSVPFTQVWEEVTRALPDDAWLIDFAFDGTSVTLSGYAERSANLISKLSSSELLGDPAFTSPVVRAPGQTGEQFELRARVISR